jgi:hypothetical protein
MRAPKSSLKKLILLLSLSLFLSCKKENDSIDIQLFDKSTQFIESYIQGKWRVHFMTGGILGGNHRSSREQLNEYYTILPGQRIIYTLRNNAISDTIYSWTTYRAGASDYLHNILNSPYGIFEVEKIYNDTLSLAEPFIGNPDFSRLLLTKEN